MKRNVENTNLDCEASGSFGRVRSLPGIKYREMYQSFERLLSILYVYHISFLARKIKSFHIIKNLEIITVCIL